MGLRTLKQRLLERDRSLSKTGSFSSKSMQAMRWRGDLFDRCVLLMQARTHFCANLTLTSSRWDVLKGHPYAG